VIVKAWWDPAAVTAMRNLIPWVGDYESWELQRGTNENGRDKVAIDYRPCRVTIDGYNGTDFTWTYDGTYLIIDWAPIGDEPEDEEYYYANVWYCGVPRIAGVEKHISTTQIVDGYSAIPLSDLGDASGRGLGLLFDDFAAAVSTNVIAWGSTWVLPIVQSNWNGWNSIVRITDVSGRAGNTYTAYFYPADGQGFGGGSAVIADGTLTKGQTVSVNLTAALEAVGYTGPAVGAVWIDSTWATVALVDRAKASTFMEITNVAQPRTDLIRIGYPGLTTEFSPAYGEARIRYAPLVFMDYNGWNTGFNMANLSGQSNRVTIEYFNYLGISLTQESKTIPPRGMEFVYRPYTGNAGLGSSNGVEQIASAIVTADFPVAVAVDEVKYIGGQGEGHAMSYAAQSAVPGSLAIDFTGFNECDFCDEPGNQNPWDGDLDELRRFFYITALALPLVQKGNPATGMGATTGMNLFNPDPNEGVWGFIQFQDGSGQPVAPTLRYVDAEEADAPILSKFGPLTSKTVYVHQFSEMPAGFRGSAIIGVVATSFINGIFGKGTLVGVSNNVDYGMENDGSAVFNMAVAAYHGIPFPDFGREGGEIDELFEVIGGLCPTLTVGGVVGGWPQSEDPCVWNGDILDAHLRGGVEVAQ